MTSASKAPDDLHASASVDESVLRTLVEELGDGDESLLDDLIGSYLADGTEQVRQFVAAARDNNATTVAAIAHSLRSASAVLGALSFASLLRQAEDHAKADGDDLTGWADLVEAEYARVAEELDQLRPTPAS